MPSFVSPTSTVSQVPSVNHTSCRSQVRKPLPNPPSGAPQYSQHQSSENEDDRSKGHHTFTNARLVPTPSNSNTSMSETRSQSPSEKGQDSHPDRVPRPHTGRLWLWEMTACVFSFVCMGAVVIVLAYEDGKALDQWRFQITPNVVISFIVTLTKSSFLMVVAEIIGQLKWLHFHSKAQRLSDLKIFDEASRGPLGSLKLLFARHRHTFIASCAASIMLLALFVDPFIQLLISFPSQKTLALKEALFQTADIYDPNGWVLDPHFTTTTASSVDTPMQAAIIESLYNGTSPLRVTCQTGNCTWDALSTLGLCGGCVDVSARTKAKDVGKVETNVHATEYTFPDDIWARSNTTLRVLQATVGASGTQRQTMWNSTADVMNMQRGYNLQNLKATLVETNSIQVPLAGDGEYLPPIRAFTCEINLCIKTYPQLVVTNGVGHLPAPREEPLLVNGSSATDPCTTDCSNVTSRHLIRDSLNQSKQDLEQYQINQSDFLSMSKYLKEMLSTGWWNVGPSTRPAPEFSGNPNILNVSPDIGRELAYSSDLDKTFKAMAESMTQAMRTARNSSSQPGKAFIHKTVIKIQWAWLVYPLVLMLLAIALLILVILQTRRHNVPAWKSSSLALLFHSLEGYDSPCGTVKTRKELDKVASGMRVRFSEGQDHAAFVKEE